MKPPPEVQIMSALGPLMKIMALFIGKQPEDRLVPQGLLGIELEAKGDDIHVAATLPDSPAAAELKPGDVLIQVGTTKIRKLADAHKALERIVPAARVKVLIRRDGEELERVLTAGEGF
jgi:S1-C subfamily serine protease